MKVKLIIITIFSNISLSIFAACTTINSIGNTIKVTPQEIITTLKILKSGLSKSQKLSKWQEPEDHLRINEATIFGSHESFQTNKYKYKTQLIQRGYIYNKKNKYSQLSLGVRYLDLRVWEKDGDLFLCHGNCDSLAQKFIKPRSGFTKLIDAFKEINQFMEDTENLSPKPVIIVCLEGGIGQVPLNKLRKVIKKSGLNKYILKTSKWDINSQKIWPTYGLLRSKNKRIILGSSQNVNTSYVFSDIFAKPRWQNLPIDYKRLLILEFGAQTDNKYIKNIQAMVKELENHQQKYRSSYIIRTMLAWWPIIKILFKSGTVKSMGQLNTQMPLKYSEYIYENGFKDIDQENILWQGHFPNIIAADFIAYGDIVKAVQDINKNLRKTQNLNIPLYEEVILE